jgi:aminobenzoyl-glutamate utilization protein B
MAGKEELLRYTSVIDEKKDVLNDTALYLWENAETAFTEFKSAAYLCDVLRKEGFEVTENLTGIATAFSGRFGHGKPVVGVLGEYDALAGLQQAGGSATKQLIEGKICGQGCGHNLLGMGSLAAAIAIRHYLGETGREGTVIFFGTPGEEGGSGKAFMARDGAFDELDMALCWHPDSNNYVRYRSGLANYQIKYIFDGQAAHAGATPHLGRSALDAVELMNVGVQFLREHMPDDYRVHYAITDTGGFSPNVVQPHAEVLYLIRATTNPEVKSLYERVNDIAKGAALMTGTKEHHEFIKACSNIVLNLPLEEVMQGVMEAIEPPRATEEEQTFCRELIKTFPAESGADPERPIHDELLPLSPHALSHGSSDVGDASWVCPTVQCGTATWPFHTPGHSWQATSMGTTEWAMSNARYAGKVMAGTAIQAIEDPEILKKAWADYRQSCPNGYDAPIPKDVKPRAITKL